MTDAAQNPLSEAASALSPIRDGYLTSVLAWQKAFVDVWVQAQRSQYQLLAVWEKAFGAMHQELWDQWACRFGGGVPLDG